MGVAATRHHRLSRTEDRPRERGGTDDFEVLARDLRPDLYRFAFWFTRDATVAEDAVQEALIRGWRSWNRLKDKSAAKAWLLTIVRRECARPYERKRLQIRNIDGLSAAEQSLISTSDNGDLGEMRRAMFRLELEYREPLILQVLMGYTAEEIGRIMGLKPGAVLTRLFRARRKLAAEFEVD